MGLEIERKFLVDSDQWRVLGEPVHYMQGYLVADGIRTVRVRVAGEKGFITIKGPTEGFSRSEFEYPIPAEEAAELLALSATPVIEKFRTRILFEGHIWEIDEFKGLNKGLILAEIELQSESQSFGVPPWIGKEVTGDVRYFNSYLSLHPYTTW